MTMLTTGIHTDISAEAYHADRESISSSGLRQVLECPRKYRFGEHSPSQALDFGRAAHQWLADPAGFSDDFVALPEDYDGRTKAGKDLLRQAREAGKTPIKHDEGEAIMAMARALREQPFGGRPLGASAFAPGAGVWEPTLVWDDPETGVRLRARPDWLPHARRLIPDYKTARSAKPDDFRRAIWTYGYHMQAAHYLDGIAEVTGEKPRRFYFVVQEKVAPFVVSIITLEDIAIEWGRLQNRRAIRRYADCLSRDYWPGYDDEVVTVGLPVWAERDLQSQHEAGAFTETFHEEQAA